MAKTILLVDDDQNVLKLFSLTVENNETDFRVISAASGEEAVGIMASEKPDLLVLDIRMKKGDGFHVLEHMQKEGIDVPVVILTNYNKPEYVKKSKNYSVVKDYLIKHDVRMDRVVDTISGHLA